MNGLSIIVCCYNSAKLLPETLQYISRLDININAPVELIIVDNASEDDTAIIAEKLWEKYAEPFNLKIILEPEAGLSFARLAGIKNAEYEYLLFCDDDNWLDEKYVIEAYNTMEKIRGIGILGGLGIAISDIEIPEWTSAFQMFGSGPQANETGIAAALYGAGVVIRKSVFQHLVECGFHFQLTDRKKNKLSSGGDYELCYAIQMTGYKAWYNEAMRFKHYIKPSRLNYAYYKKYVKDTSVSNNILGIYTALLKNHELSFTKFCLRLLWQFVSHIKYDLQLGYKLLFQKISGNKNTFQVFISLYYHRLRTWQVFSFIFSCKKYFMEIKKLSECLNKNKITLPDFHH